METLNVIDDQYENSNSFLWRHYCYFFPEVDATIVPPCETFSKRNVHTLIFKKNKFMLNVRVDLTDIMIKQSMTYECEFSNDGGIIKHLKGDLLDHDQYLNLVSYFKYFDNK